MSVDLNSSERMSQCVMKGSNENNINELQKNNFESEIEKFSGSFP